MRPRARVRGRPYPLYEGLRSFTESLPSAAIASPEDRTFSVFDMDRVPSSQRVCRLSGGVHFRTGNRKKRLLPVENGNTKGSKR